MKRDSILKYIIKSKLTKAILVISLAWNVIWCINWYQYHTHITGYTKSYRSYYKDISDCICTVAPPRYLRLTGNYAINNNQGIGIIIWPPLLFLGKPEYGVEIRMDDSVYRLYMDEKFNYCKDRSILYSKDEEATVKSILEINKKELQRMMKIATEEWNL